jgi:hypothetical protein
MEVLDVVELLKEIDGVDVDHPWPAGTEGTVLELWTDSAMIEISNDDGETLDMPTIAFDQVKVVWAIKDHRVPQASDGITVRVAATRSSRP